MSVRAVLAVALLIALVGCGVSHSRTGRESRALRGHAKHANGNSYA